MNARPLASALALVFVGCDETSPSLDATVPPDGLANNGAWAAIAGATCNAEERNVATQESPHVDPSAGRAGTGSTAWSTAASPTSTAAPWAPATPPATRSSR